MASLSLFSTCPLPRMAQSMCWSNNVAAFAVGPDVHVVDVSNGQTVALLRGPVRTDRVDLVLAAASHAFLVCLTRHESACVYNLHDYSLLCTLGASKSTDGDGSGFVAACVSSVHPFVFYARRGSKQIYMLDLTAQRATGKFDGKKTVTCLAAHPTKPLFASGHIDGSVRVWDYQLGSCRVSEEYNLFAQNSARLAPSPFGVTTITLSGDMALVGSPIALVIAFRVSSKGLTMVAARVLNASRGTTSLGVLTALEYHASREFFLSCFSEGKIQSWRVVHAPAEDKHSIVRSADVAPADFMHLLRSAYKSTLPAYIVPPTLRQFVVRRIVLHPSKYLVAFGLEQEYDDTSTIDLTTTTERLHPIFDLTSSCNPKVPRLPAAASFGAPFVGFSPTDSDLYYVKRGQLVAYSLQSNENVILRPIPEVGPTVHAARVCVAAGFVIVIVEKVEAIGSASAVSSTTNLITVANFSKLSAAEKPSKRVNIVSTAYVLSKSGSSMDGLEARDALFLNKDHYAVLGSNGLSLSVVHTVNANRQTYEGWQVPVDRIFPGGPASDGVLYFSSVAGTLSRSRDARHATAPLAYNVGAEETFALQRKEMVLQLEWQSFGSVRGPACFVLTTQRLLVLDERLHLVTQAVCEANSALWGSSAVLFSRKEGCTIDYLCLDGRVGCLVATDGDSDTNLCAMFRDRVMYVAPSMSDTQIKAVLVWPFECVANGILGLDASDSVTEELLKAAMQSFDFATMVSRDLIARLIERRFVAVCRQILAAAPALASRLAEDGVWTDDLPAPAAAPANVLVSRPDHAEGWMVQKLDVYRGVSMKASGDDGVPPLGTSSQAVLQSSSAAAAAVTVDKFLASPPGFAAVTVQAATLPLLSTVTTTSSLISTDLTPVRLVAPIQKLKSLGTPVFQVRKPPPRTALPPAPSDSDHSSPSSSQTHLVPITLPKAPEEADEVEDEDNDSSSPGRSPLLSNRRVSIADADDSSTFSRLPFVPRAETGDIVVPVTDPVRASGSSSLRGSQAENESTFASLIVGLGNAEDDGVLLERGNILCDEAVSLFDLRLWSEAAVQASEALLCFAQAEPSEARQSRLRLCSNYKVAATLLARRQKDSDARAALLTTLAASFAGIDAEHRKLVVVDAFRENVRAKNFRVAKSFVVSFQRWFDDKSKEAEAVLAMDGPKDAQEWCDAFGSAMDPILFCVETARILTSADKFYQCNDCLFAVSASAATDAKACGVCGNVNAFP